MDKENNPLKITDTTLRDAHQSLWATRMLLEDILPIAEKIDSVGYHSVEVWGGATFDVCIRYLEEDPWERLFKIKEKFKKTPLQMLLRGQNIVGYKNYPDDLLEEFIKKAVQGGIDIFRVFDALNDIRNVEKAVKTIKKEKAQAQGSICYTRSPIHNLDLYVNTAKKLVDIGVDSINIKDMSGILTPFDAYDLVTALKAETGIPVQLHCHSSSGMATAAYVKASEAGVDVIDCAAAPLALYTSQPAVETMIAIMRESVRATSLNFNNVHSISEYWEDISLKHKFFRKHQSLIDVSVIEHQIPGGMVSNLLVQLEEQKAIDKFEEVLEEVPKVREDMGWPPLVTPMSQIIGTQAVLNVISGARYKVTPRELKDYIRGMYGRPPGEIDPEIKKKLAGATTSISCRPADLLKPIFENSKRELEQKGLKQKDEDIITYALFPEMAIEYFKRRGSKKKNNKKTQEVTQDKYRDIALIVKTISKTSLTNFSWENKGQSVYLKRSPLFKKIDIESEPIYEDSIDCDSESDNYIKILSNKVGVFSFNNHEFTKGNVFEKGQVIGVIEAMRVKNDIAAEFKCRFIDSLVEDQEPVEYDQPIYLVEPIED